MQSPQECLEQADKCLAWSKLVKDQKERDALLEMARDWLYCAIIIERLSEPSKH
jgi:hypothetical protein